MADTFATLSKSVTEQLSALNDPDQLDDAGRHKLASELSDLVREIQPPAMILQGFNGGVLAMVGIKIASGMGVFDAFAANSNKSMTLDELHSQSKGDKVLLVRMLRLLAAHGVVKQISKDEWEPSTFGTGFTTDSMQSHLLEHLYEMMRTHAIINDYLKSNEYRNPNDAYNGPWQAAYGTKEHYFGWLDSNDEAQKSFNTVMTMHQQFRGQNWFDFYPVEQKLSTTSDTETLLVDIGGGMGHDAIAFHERFPDLRGKIVIQDLPRVINAISQPLLPPTITAQAHDMFTTQPLTARAYYLRTVLHDWPDKQALQILKHIRNACSSDSILLINEGITPEDYVSPMSTTYDFIMMTTCSSMERSESQWTQLIADAGFKLVKVWKPDGLEVVPLALFEAVPV